MAHLRSLPALRCEEYQPALNSVATKHAIHVEDNHGNKKIKGRKRHLLVDTLGLILAVVVTDAGTDDRVGWVELLSAYFCRRHQAPA
jgi:hypothetical protein